MHAVLSHPEDLRLELAEVVAFEHARLTLDQRLRIALDAARAEMLTALARGPRVYGVHTGMGYLAGTDLPPEARAQHQRTLLLGRAVGSAPWLPVGEARAVLVARLASFLTGRAGVSAELCAFLVDRLNDDFHPAIPATGMGSAGEVIPLAHAFQTFLGVGAVLDGEGRSRDAAAALRARGAEPYDPGEKEGVALLAGAPATTGLAIARWRAVRTLAAQLIAAAAASITALCAPLAPYDPALRELDDDPVLGDVLDRLQAALGGQPSGDASRQAPVSFRVVPQVLAHVQREVRRLEQDVRHALRTVGDSPAFVRGEFLSNGGFHAVQLAADLDTVAAALVRAAELAGQRLHRLLDGRFSGLPDQLAADPGPQTGLVAVHKRAAGVLNELRRLTEPASVGLVDTSLGQEDAMTFAFEAAAKLRRVEALAREVTACELLAARQAWALRGRPPPTFAERLAEAVEPVLADRPLGPDIAAVVGLLERGELFSEG